MATINHSQIKVGILLSRFDMTGMTTNAIDLFEGLRQLDGVTAKLIVGISDTYKTEGVISLYEKYSNDPDVEFFPCSKLSKLALLKTTWNACLTILKGGYDLIHCESPYYGFVPWLCRKKFLLTMHVTDIYPKPYFKRGCHCISISHETTDWAVNVCHYKPENITMVPHGVSTRFAQPLSEELRVATMQRYGIPSDKVYIGLVGSVEPRKGHDVLLKAVASLSEDIRQKVHIIFVGSDKDKLKRSQRWLDNLVEETGLRDSVTQVEYCDPYPLYKIIDIQTLPSRQEGFPLTAIEGMMSGDCVVRSNCEGADLQITDSVDGRVFEIDDIPALADILAKLVTDSNYRLQLANAGQAKALKQFSNVRMAADTLAVYRSVL